MSRLLRLGVLLGLLCLAFTGAAIGAPGDTDNDTFADASDNCPTAYNFDQRDQDADGVGDVCDATPGVLPDRTIYYTYFRDRTTGGPLPSCAQLHWYSTPAGFDFNVCFFAFSSSVIGSGTVTIDVLSPPAGCLAETSSLTFGPPTAGQLGTVQTTTIWFVCTATQLSNLAAASAGVGSGSSLADKVAAIQTAVAAGDTATACGALTGYINHVRAQSGKKIATVTANDLIAKAEAIKTTLGC